MKALPGRRKDVYLSTGGEEGKKVRISRYRKPGCAADGKETPISQEFHAEPSFKKKRKSQRVFQGSKGNLVRRGTKLEGENARTKGGRGYQEGSRLASRGQKLLSIPQDRKNEKRSSESQQAS